MLCFDAYIATAVQSSTFTEQKLRPRQAQSNLLPQFWSEHATNGQSFGLKVFSELSPQSLLDTAICLDAKL